MHNHTPSQYKNSFIRFAVFLLSPIKVYHYYIDGADYCSECNSSITVPTVYYSPYLKGMYILVGAACGYLFSGMHYYFIVPTALLLILFHHVVSAFILAFFSWEPYNPEKYSITYASARATVDIDQKVKCLFLGFLILTVYCLISK